MDDIVPLAVRQIGPDLSTSNVINWTNNYTTEELRKAQKEDPSIAKVITWLESGQQPPDGELWLSSAESKHLWLCKNLLSLENGVLHYRMEGPDSTSLFVVPASLREEVMKFHHDVRNSGHLGQEKTLHKVRESFFWYGMAKDIVLYVKTCAKCSKNKKPKAWPKASLGTYHAGIPLERVHIDISLQSSVVANHP